MAADEPFALSGEQHRARIPVDGSCQALSQPKQPSVDRIIDQFPTGEQEQIRTMLANALLGVVSQILCKKREHGRVAAYEVLLSTPAVSNIIREGKTFQLATLMQTGKALGNRLMNDSLLELAEGGIVSPEEALSKSVDKDALKTRLKFKRLIEGE